MTGESSGWHGESGRREAGREQVREGLLRGLGRARESGTSGGMGEACHTRTCGQAARCQRAGLGCQLAWGAGIGGACERGVQT